MLKVIVTTYVPEDQPQHPRAMYLGQVLHALELYLEPHEPTEIVVANDGPLDQPHIVLHSRLGAEREIKGWTLYSHRATGGPRVGIGGSLNRALETVGPDDIWMYTTDDWMLTEEYDLRQALRLIREDNYDYVRLGPPHPNITCETRFRQGLGWWLELRPECGGFAFATRPFLATRRFYDVVGPFKERCDAYECEKHYAREVQSVDYELKLAEVVNGSLEGPWEHIGEVEVGDRWP